MPFMPLSEARTSSSMGLMETSAEPVGCPATPQPASRMAAKRVARIRGYFMGWFSSKWGAAMK
ncbi:hypothetical protein D3C72_2552330 [compost metagenome]